jgi:type IV pilus assembly protein PilE
MNNKNNVICKSKQIGFSLIEVMITVAILGIISSIAYPSYMKQVQKSKRTPAKVELMRIAQLQESYYVQNLSYAKVLNGVATAGGLGFSSATIQTEGGDYDVKVESKTPSDCDGTSTKPCIAYTLSAVPVSTKPQAHDESCAGFELTNTGAKFAKKSSDTDYSSTTSRDECW